GGVPLTPLRPDEPLWPGALVRRPAQLPGVRGWSIEKRDAPDAAAVAYRPDGKRLAVASREGRGIRIWDPENGRLVQILGGQGTFTALAWSPDGRVLAVGTGGDGPVQLWEAETGQLLGLLAPPVAQTIGALAWSPDGRTLLAAGRRECLVWDAADRK